MTGEQVLKDGIQDVMFFTVEFRVLVKREVARAANTLHRAQHVDGLAFQGLEFFTHILSGGWEF